MPFVGHSVFLLLAWLPLAAAAQTALPVSVGTTRFEAHVKSMRELRDEDVVRQRYDYSCGSAALATLLAHGLGARVAEEDILREILKPLSGDELAALHKRGLSLFELQQYAQAHGYKAQGFRVMATQLSKVSRPVLVHVRPHGYDHFAVLKGVRGGRAYVADPSFGNLTMPLYRFLDMWTDASGRGVVFAVERADGAWPQTYPLQVAGDPSAFEALTTRELLNIAAAR
jgi:predicted double-glycine peptidase